MSRLKPLPRRGEIDDQVDRVVSTLITAMFRLDGLLPRSPS